MLFSQDSLDGFVKSRHRRHPGESRGPDEKD